MSKIPKIFRSNNFAFEQLKRLDNIAIYGKFKEDFKKETYHYEVIVIQSHNGYYIKESYVPPSEFYPSSQSWGLSGFTFRSLEDAEKKFEQLIELKNARRKIT